MNWLTSLFKRTDAVTATAPHNSHSSIAVHPAQPIAPTIPVYPPVDAGLAFLAPDEILNSQADLVRRLRMLAGGTDEAFDKYYRDVLLHLAEYVQLLPASRSETHIGAGGLFRFCLEMGFFSLQSAGKIVFAGHEGVEKRRNLEPRWRYATFLAGLCAELYRPLSDMLIVDQDGEPWPKYTMSLTKWAADRKIDRYFVRWQKKDQLHTSASGRADVSVMMNAVIPKFALQYLEDGSPNIVPVLFAVATGSAHPSDSATARIIDDTRKRILARDAANRKDQYGKYTVGMHLAPYLLDAVRSLYSSGEWTVNQNKSRLWYASDGLFAVWKSAAKDIQRTLREQGVEGIPTEPTTLAESMMESGILARGPDNSPFVTIKPPGSETEWLAVKIANPLSVLQDDEVEPLNLAVVVKSGDLEAEKKPEFTHPMAPPTPSAPNPPQPPKVKAKPKAADPVPTESRPIDANRDLIAMAGEEPVSASSGNVPKPEAAAAAPAAVAAPPTARPSRDADAEIAPVAAQISYSDLVNPTMRAALKPDIVEVLGKMIEDYRTGRHSQQIADVNGAIAFDVQLIFSYGLPMERLVSTLFDNGWLETPAANPMKKVISTPMNGNRMTPCVVLKKSAALLLGFRDEAAE